jgi:hypothetical protein
MGNYLKSPEFDGLLRPSDYNDLFKLSREPVYDEDLYYRTRIHRLYAKIAVGNLTITGGRQLVRFGSGRLWNPLDIMNPISPTALEGIEEQKGIDARRMEYYINATTEIGLVVDRSGTGTMTGFHHRTPRRGEDQGFLREHRTGRTGGAHRTSRGRRNRYFHYRS